MAASFSFQIEGLDEITKQLKSIASDMRGKVIRKALKGASNIFLSHAIFNAPSLSGALVAGMSTSVRPKRGDRSVLVALIGQGKAEFYGKFAEYGTRRQAAKPWLRPAFETGKREASDFIHDTVADYVKSAGT